MGGNRSGVFSDVASGTGSPQNKAMNAPFKTPNAEAPLWDLTDLYASRDDARVGADLERAKGLVDALNALQGATGRREGCGRAGRVAGPGDPSV